MQDVTSESVRHAAERNGVDGQPARGKRQGWIGSIALIVALALCGAGLALWKVQANKKASAAAANQPEPIESVALGVAKPREHRRTTTSIGTIVATRSITLRNELAGTVREVSFTPGQVVEAGTILVAQDVSVEEAELKAQEAQAALADTLLSRMERGVQHRATAQMELDRARAERDVAQAQIARAKAVIGRKTIRAPFRARVGLADVHSGQYLEAGTLLASLQGIDSGAFIDFTVTQQVGQLVQEGQQVEVLAGGDSTLLAKIAAIDSRTDPTTRNTMVRARLENGQLLPPPGASLPVRVPVGEPLTGVAIPVSALRKGPGGDHVFTIAQDEKGKSRAHVTPVQTGAVLGDEVLILSGLKSGDQVAASGSFKLREGVLVAVAPGSQLNVATNNAQRSADKSVN